MEHGSVSAIMVFILGMIKYVDHLVRMEFVVMYMEVVLRELFKSLMLPNGIV